MAQHLKEAPRAQSTAVLDLLNKQVANWSVLYMKLHNYHWNVKGKHFFELHVKLEELYNEAAEHLDTIAERVLSLGGKPIATLKESLAESSLKEAGGEKTETDMVGQVVADFETIISELGKGVSISEEHDDSPTADMLTGVKASLQKHVWMLKAFLG